MYVYGWVGVDVVKEVKKKIKENHTAFILRNKILYDLVKLVDDNYYINTSMADAVMFRTS